MFEGEDGGGQGDFGTIRLLSYPGRVVHIHNQSDGDVNSDDDDDEERERTGIGAHTDFECFTLMHQNAPGLQIMPRNNHTNNTNNTDEAHGQGNDQQEFGDWIDAPVRPNDFLVILGDMFERLTNGLLRATPHRVCQTDHLRESIIRFNAFAPDTIVRPLDVFVNSAAEGTPQRPLYTPVKMRTHMETTMRNLEKGIASWDAAEGRSRSATYRYEHHDE
jgi:isopenicillin N synthase-like dioxygenase